LPEFLVFGSICSHDYDSFVVKKGLKIYKIKEKQCLAGNALFASCRATCQEKVLPFAAATEAKAITMHVYACSSTTANVPMCNTDK
jgi:hypothetical protein